MIDQNIGNPEITRKHLSELQTFYEAQLVAKRHYDALMTSLKPLQDAADVLRASGVVNVDALLSQPVSATKAMIDEMEAEADADELNDLTPHEGEEVEDAFKNLNKAADIMHDRAAEIDAPAYETVTGTETDIPPMPKGEGWMRNTGVQPFDDDVRVDIVKRAGGTNNLLASAAYWPLDPPIEGGEIFWYRKIQKPTVEQEAEATAQIEAQAESEPEFKAGDVVHTLSGEKRTIKNYWPETDEDTESFDLIGEDGTTYWDVSPDTLAIRSAQPESTETEAEPDTAETMQAIAQAVEAVDAEPEAATEETVTEQPETVEAEPETPAEPKAERKTLDCTGDFTQEEILAQSGGANFDAPRRQFYNPWAPTAKAEG